MGRSALAAHQRKTALERLGWRGSKRGGNTSLPPEEEHGHSSHERKDDPDDGKDPNPMVRRLSVDLRALYHMRGRPPLPRRRPIAVSRPETLASSAAKSSSSSSSSKKKKKRGSLRVASGIVPLPRWPATFPTAFPMLRSRINKAGPRATAAKSPGGALPKSSRGSTNKKRKLVRPATKESTLGIILLHLIAWLLKLAAPIISAALLGETLAVAHLNPLSPILRMAPYLNQLVLIMTTLAIVCCAATFGVSARRYGPRGQASHVIAAILGVGTHVGMAAWFGGLECSNEDWQRESTANTTFGMACSATHWWLVGVGGLVGGLVFGIVLMNGLKNLNQLKTTQLALTLLNKFVPGPPGQMTIAIAAFLKAFWFLFMFLVLVGLLRAGQTSVVIVNLIVAAVAAPIVKVLVRRAAAKASFNAWADGDMYKAGLALYVIPLSSTCTEVVTEITCKFLLLRTCAPNPPLAVDAAGSSLVSSVGDVIHTIRTDFDSDLLNGTARTAAREIHGWIDLVNSNQTNPSLVGTIPSLTLFGTPQSVKSPVARSWDSRNARPPGTTGGETSWFAIVLLAQLAFDYGTRALYPLVMHWGKRVRVAKRFAEPIIVEWQIYRKQPPKPGEDYDSDEEANKKPVKLGERLTKEQKKEKVEDDFATSYRNPNVLIEDPGAVNNQLALEMCTAAFNKHDPRPLPPDVTFPTSDGEEVEAKDSAKTRTGSETSSAGSREEGAKKNDEEDHLGEVQVSVIVAEKGKESEEEDENEGEEDEEEDDNRGASSSQVKARAANGDVCDEEDCQDTNASTIDDPQETDVTAVCEQKADGEAIPDDKEMPAPWNPNTLYKVDEVVTFQDMVYRSKATTLRSTVYGQSGQMNRGMKPFAASKWWDPVVEEASSTGTGSRRSTSSSRRREEGSRWSFSRRRGSRSSSHSSSSSRRSSTVYAGGLTIFDVGDQGAAHHPGSAANKAPPRRRRLQPPLGAPGRQDHRRRNSLQPAPALSADTTDASAGQHGGRGSQPHAAVKSYWGRKRDRLWELFGKFSFFRYVDVSHHAYDPLAVLRNLESFDKYDNSIHSRDLFLHALQAEAFEYQTGNEFCASLFGALVAGYFTVVLRSPFTRHHALLSLGGLWDDPAIVHAIAAGGANFLAQLLCTAALRPRGIDPWAFARLVGPVRNWARLIAAAVIAFQLLMLSQLLPF